MQGYGKLLLRFVSLLILALTAMGQHPFGLHSEGNDFFDGDALSQEGPFQVPASVSGVEWESLPKPFPIFMRYAPWVYEPHKETMTPLGWEAFVGSIQPRTEIARQNALLEEAFGVNGWADFISYGPQKPDGLHLSQNYFPEGTHPFAILYEYAGSSRYISTPCLGDNQCIDFANPINQLAFFGDLDQMFEEVIMPYRHRYLTRSGKAVIYFWVPPLLRNIEEAFALAKLRYPVWFVLSNPGGDEQWRERMTAADAIGEYNIYARKDYLPSVLQYQKTSRSLAQEARAVGIPYYPTFIPAYDDTRQPGRNNPPAIPQSIVEQQLLLDHIGLGMLLGEFAPALFVTSWDELYEGTSVIPAKEHVAPFMRGRTLLNLLAFWVRDMRMRGRF